MLILTRKVGARNAFVFRAAVNPSLDAADKIPVLYAPQNKHRPAFGALHATLCSRLPHHGAIRASRDNWPGQMKEGSRC